MIRPDGRFIAIEKKVRTMSVCICVYFCGSSHGCVSYHDHRPPALHLPENTQAYDQFAKEGKVDGEKWIAKEDPPAEYTDVLESSTDKAPMPVME